MGNSLHLHPRISAFLDIDVNLVEMEAVYKLCATAILDTMDWPKPLLHRFVGLLSDQIRHVNERFERLVVRWIMVSGEGDVILGMPILCGHFDIEEGRIQQ